MKTVVGLIGFIIVYLFSNWAPISLVYLLLNVCTLSIGYFILKKNVSIRIWRFLAHVLSAIVGGSLIQSIIFFRWKDIGLIVFTPPGGGLLGRVFFLIGVSLFISLILGGYNYWLSRKFLNLSKKQSIFIGIIMGIFTNLFWLFPLLLLLIWLRGLL